MAGTDLSKNRKGETHSPGLEKMREMVARQYDSDKWRDRVANMPAKQVYAIYRKWKEAGVFDRRPKHKIKVVEPSMQISIWDLGIDLYGKGSSELRDN